MWSRWKKPASLGAGLLSTLWVFSGPALAQAQPSSGQPPSGDELHSLYCVELLRAEIALQQHMISAATEAAGAAPAQLRDHWIDTSSELLRRLAQLESTVYRLQLYMLPRIPGVDSLALAAAIRQANADIQESWNSQALLSRAAACENPPWLPP